MLEYWKRAESTLVMMWGMTGFEEQEEDRPEFTGDTIPSPVNGDEETYFPPVEKYKAIGVAAATLVGCITTVTGVFASVFALSAFVNHHEDIHGELMNEAFDGAQLFPYLLCAMVVQVASAIFTGIAIFLTDMENHRTDTEYEDAVITKTFLFEFFNSYGPCFYIVFLKVPSERQGGL